MSIDLGDYPSSHSFMFYTNAESVPQPIHEALDAMSDCSGLKVSVMMSKIIRSLDKATAGSRLNPVDLEDGDPMAIDSDQGNDDEHVSL